jgi:hypothetical protein
MADVNPNALNNLADALCQDITRTSDQELLAEAAEDYGDRAPARGVRPGAYAGAPGAGPVGSRATGRSGSFCHGANRC